MSRPRPGCGACAERRRQEQAQLEQQRAWAQAQAARPPAEPEEDDNTFVLLIAIGFVGFLVYLLGVSLRHLRDELGELLELEHPEEAGGEA